MSKQNNSAGSTTGNLLPEELILQQAERVPEAVAVQFRDESCSYADLQQRSARLALLLQQQGVRPGDYVGIWLERSVEMVVAILATLRAGAAYLPLDPAYPADRLDFILSDTAARVLVSRRHYEPALQALDLPCLYLDDDGAMQADAVLQPVNATPASPAYIIYTSGSTGTPKGVPVNRAQLLFSTQARMSFYNQPVDRFLLLSSFSFDSSVAGIFWTLMQGGTLCLPPSGMEQDVQQIGRLIEQQRVSHTLMLPSLYALLLEQNSRGRLASLDTIIVAGEACPADLLKRHFGTLPQTRLFNEYGPTETTVWCTVYQASATAQSEVVPIGKAIDYTDILLLDAQLQAVPPGAEGELYIAGPGVTAGYLNRPEITAERFLEVPPHLQKLQRHSSGYNRMYRSGDLARLNAAGELEFCGRADQQIKIRGFRIEPGEIEALLLEEELVLEASVILREDQPGLRRLVAYLRHAAGKPPLIAALRGRLLERLPEYMLPTAFVSLEQFPRTPNGKVDRAAFPPPDRRRPELEQAFVPPRDELEKRLAAIWCDILDLESVGIRDRFFELGGDSLLAARFTGKLQQLLQEPVFVVTLFESPSIEAYARFLRKDYSEAIAGMLNEQPAAAQGEGGDKTLTADDFRSFEKLIPRLSAGAPSRERKTANKRAMFILAPPRSGTTLLRVMLAGHPQLFAANELQLLGFHTLRERAEAYTGKFSAWLDGAIRTVMELHSCNADQAREWIEGLAQKGTTTKQFFHLLQQEIGERILVDKSPQYALDPAALQKAERDFDQPLYIQLLRHPYAMVTSFAKRRMDQVLYVNKHPFTGRQLGELVWETSHRVVAGFLRDIPDSRQLILRYEDLVGDPRAALTGLCNTFGLPFDEALLNPYADLDKKMTDGIYAESTPMGDPKLLEQQGINPALADSWKGVLQDNFLSEQTWQLAEHYGYQRPARPLTQVPVTQDIPAERQGSSDIAIIGMAVRLPGADSIEQFWQNLQLGVESIIARSDSELLEAGVPAGQLQDPSYVKAVASMQQPAGFDAAFFGYHKREAEMMDPQHRMFLEGAYWALEHAGYDPERYPGEIGVFGGVGRNGYLVNNMLTHPQLREAAGEYTTTLGSEKDFPATRVAYKLNLRGPAMTVQTACSTTGVAIHLACQSLRSGDCRMAIVGGGRIEVPLNAGYHYVEGGPLSPDGHVRAFDARAQGMVKSSGGAFLVLKPLAEAIQDRDSVYAVIKGSALNNDGSNKIGFTAPSVPGQAAVITRALAISGVHPESIGYVEAHGTGTILGDPIEVGALTRAWRRFTGKTGYCALGSVKTNIGHLDAGACAAGVIKAALALYYAQIPPNLHFSTANPQLELPQSPFFVNNRLIDWPDADQSAPRRAAVSSLGLGGTNAHIILEAATERQSAPAGRSWQLLPLSARSDTALQQMRQNLAGYLEQNPQINLADAAYTLQVGRRRLAECLAVVASNAGEAQELLRNALPHQLIRHTGQSDGRSLAFMFAGGGAQYLNMGRDLYQREPLFRAVMDECAGWAGEELEGDLRALIYSDLDDAAALLEKPAVALPALFAVQYACARLWMSWGITPQAMIGHSMGEYTAACLAGVFTAREAMQLVGLRGRLFETLAPGSMLSVALPEAQTRELISDELSIAAINRTTSCVVSGPTPAIEALQQVLEKKEIESTRLRISVAAHSVMVEPILEPFRKFLQNMQFNAPQIPFVSNVTGTWITAAEAVDPDYWVKHLRQTVRFADGLGVLLQDPDMVLLEAGPGQTLSTFARQHPAKNPAQVVVCSLRHPREEIDDQRFLLTSAGRLWACGVDLDWAALHQQEERGRIALPVYPFERQNYWIEPACAPETAPAGAIPAVLHQQASNEDMHVTTPVTQARPRSERIADELQGIIHELSGVDLAAIDRQATFLEMGFDSLFLTQANSAFQKLFKVKISFRQLFDEAPTINALSAFIDSKLAPSAFPPAVEEALPVAAPAAVSPLAAAAPVPAAAPQAFAPLAVSADAGAVERVVQQQLQLMQQQLQLLQGGGVAMPAAAPLPAANGSGPATAPAATAPAARAAAAAKEKSDGAAHGPWKPVQRKKADDYTPEQYAALNRLIEDYTAKTRGSKELTQAQRKHLADPRAISGFRHVWKEMIYQIAGERSKGCRVWDVDGNEYIDLNMGFGINFFGHSPDFVLEALQEQLARGMELGVLTPLARDVADLICEITGMDRVNFVNTGSEAVAGAVRAARTATGRDRIAVFANDYHGIADELLVRPVDLAGKRLSKPVSPGIPDFLVENVLILDYNDSCIAQIREHADELAAVIFEPVPAHDPAFQPREIIHKVREVTRELGIAMIFDELITGFRLHPRGAQGYYDVDVDICAYGKVLCGGLPMAAVAGRAKYMDAFDGGMWQFGDDSYPEGGVTFFGGTFVRHPVCLSTSRIVLQKFREHGTGLHDELNARTARFTEQVNELFRRLQVPMEMVHCASMILIRFTVDGPFNALFWYYLRLHGVLFRDRSGFLCLDHSEEDLRLVLDIIERSVRDMQKSGFMPGEQHISGVHAATANGTAAATIVASSGADKMPLSTSQMEIWLASQIDPTASASFNLSSRIMFTGALDKAALSSAFRQVQERHESLRTTIAASGDYQQVHPAAAAVIAFHDLSGLAPAAADARHKEVLQEESQKPFDLSAGPLLRAQLLTLGDHQHELVLSAHHIICDGWSFSTLLKDLAAFYSAAAGAGAADLSLPLQFRDFLDIQRENREISGEDDAAYWLSLYQSGAPVLELPSDRPRPRLKTYRGNFIRRTLDKQTFDGVKKLARERKSTAFGLLLGAYGVLLSRLTGQEDLVVGLAAAGQTSLGKQEVVGHCVTLLPLRLQVDGSMPFENYFQSVKDLLIEAYDHQEYTFGDLIARLELPRDPSRLPLVGTMITYETGDSALNFQGLQVETAPNPKGFCNFDVELYLMEHGNELTMRMEYNSDLFDQATIERWMNHFQVLLDGLVSQPQLPNGDLPLHTAAELQQLLQEQQESTRAFPENQGLHQLFEQQVDSLNNDQLAVVQPAAGSRDGEEKRVTYFELEDGANRLANFLQTSGVQPGDFVGIYLDRTPAMLVSLLAVLKAGGSYVPLDPAFPADRIAFMISDSGMRCVISSEDLRDDLPQEEVTVVCLDENHHRIAAITEQRPDIAVDPQRAAYVIYTSGSTGKPKGVQVPHRAVVNFMTTIGEDRPGISPDDVMLALTTISFDISILELFLPLSFGASLVLASREDQQDGLQVADYLENYDITMMQATPTHWALMLESGWSGKENLKILCGGEALPLELARQLVSRGAGLWNMYGPTETTIWSATARLEGELTQVPIGKAIGNNQLYVLDRRMQPQPAGVAGELYIGGDGLAIGYLNRPELTAERFVNHTLPGEKKPRRLYRTGDVVRREADGTLLFMGRSDNQIKIRGFRIELGEIETLLTTHPAIEQAVAAVMDFAPGDQRLVAYLISAGNTVPDSAELRALLRHNLPDYMIPGAYVQLDSFPQTPNGKVDRKRLPLPATSGQTAADTHVAPRNATEETLQQIWQEVLGIPQIGVEDDFFDLGGHSLLATRVTTRMNAAFDINLRLSVIFEHPTIASLAGLVEANPGTEQHLAGGVEELEEGTL